MTQAIQVAERLEFKHDCSLVEVGDMSGFNQVSKSGVPVIFTIGGLIGEIMLVFASI
jgi:hypothetical protein